VAVPPTGEPSSVAGHAAWLPPHQLELRLEVLRGHVADRGAEVATGHAAGLCVSRKDSKAEKINNKVKDYDNWGLANRS
jgi:hypothetical protein